MIQPVVLVHDPMYVLPMALGAAAFVSTTLLEVGDFLSNETGVVLMDLVTENATFIGISGGKTNTLMTAADYIPVYLKCIIEVDATSATYAVGAGLKYTSKNALVADSNVDTIAWCWDYDTATRTRIKALIDVPLLSYANGVIFDAATL